jgi:hypothetical protein
MRLWQWLVAVMCAALVLAIVRDDAGRVAMVVFVTGLGEVAVGTASLMMLFQTIARVGDARGFFGHVEALAESALVLVLATAAMNALLWAGVWMVQHVVFA